MKVLEEKVITKLRIEYDNSNNSNDRDEVFRYLDNKYGVLGYKVTRQGPVIGRKNNIGLMIIETD